MNMNLFPAFRLLVPFIAGIGLKIYAGVEINGQTELLILFFLFLTEFKYTSNKINSLPLLRVRRLIFPFAIVLAGCFVATSHDIRNNENYYEKKIKSESFLRVRVDEPVEEKNATIKVDCKIQDVITNGNVEPAEGNIILYVEQNDSARALQYGDVLLIKNKLVNAPATKNPYEFDYKKYLSYQHIFQTAYLKSNDWIKTGIGFTNPFYKLSFYLRQKSLDALRSNVTDEVNEGVAEALVLGYRNSIDKETENEYAEAGVVHVLAVSGMHVSILLTLINLLLFPIAKKKKFILPKTIFVLALTWLFALMTGMSGSVIRAAVMFTFVSIGEATGRPKNNFNMLAASAFCILFFDPTLLADVGMQLSYAAMVGIYLLNQPITEWLRGWQFLPGLNGTISTSLGAQFGTVPVTLFYFNQFPIYFLLANFIVIPLATLGLIAGIACAALNFIPPVAQLSGNIVNVTILSMNTFISWINTLPYAVKKFGEINLLTSLFLGFTFLQLFLFFRLKRKKFLWLGLCSAILMIGFYQFHFLKNEMKNQLTIYSLNKTSAISFKNGNTQIILADKDESDYDFFTQKYFQRFQKAENIDYQNFYLLKNDSIENETICKHKNFILFGNKKLLVVDSSFNIYHLNKMVHVDFVLLSHNPRIKIEKLTDKISFNELIIDNSNSAGRKTKWKTACDSLNLKYFDTNERGAFQADF